MSDKKTKAKIVLIEDNPALSEIYQTRLELMGHKVLSAQDGIAGLYLVQTERPDLVLLDMMVPAIAGDEVLKRMRNTEWGKDIPVLIVSNLDEEEAPAGIRDLGISGYVVKADIGNDEIDKLVEEILKNPDKKLAGK